MNGIETAVKAYLDSQNWHYQHDAEKHIFRLGMRLDEEDLSCRVTYEFKVPESKRAAVTEYVTRVNYGMFLGNFQMDLRDGEIFYKTYGVFSDGVPQNDEIRRIVQVAIRMAEKYGQGFYEVMYKGASPKTVVEQIEAND